MGLYVTKNILETISSQYFTFTKTEQKVAQFILEHKEEIPYMAIATFAEQCAVGEATVFRFCKTLSLCGYHELKLAVARALTKNQMYSSIWEDDIQKLDQIQASDNFTDMCKKLYRTQAGALAHTIELANEEEYLKAVNYLQQADRVFCFGQGNSLVLAMVSWSRFLSVSGKFYFVEDSHLQATNVALCNENDVILFFSYSGATREACELLPVAKENGAKVILITRFDNSEAAKFADVILLCGCNEGPLQVGSMEAKFAQMMIIDILYTLYCMEDKKQCDTNSDKTAQMISKKLV